MLKLVASVPQVSGGAWGLICIGVAAGLLWQVKVKRNENRWLRLAVLPLALGGVAILVVDALSVMA